MRRRALLNPEQPLGRQATWGSPGFRHQTLLGRRKPVRAVADNTVDSVLPVEATAKGPVVGTGTLDIAKSPLKSGTRVYSESADGLALNGRTVGADGKEARGAVCAVPYTSRSAPRPYVRCRTDLRARPPSHSWWLDTGRTPMILHALGAVVFFVTLWSALQFEGMPHQIDGYTNDMGKKMGPGTRGRRRSKLTAPAENDRSPAMEQPTAHPMLEPRTTPSTYRPR